MNKLEKIRHNIEKTRRASIFKSIPVDEGYFQSLFENAAIYTAMRSDLNLLAFPVLSFGSTQRSDSRREDVSNGQVWGSRELQLRGCNLERKPQIVSLKEDTRRRRKFCLEPVKNLKELMTKSLAPAVRINKTSELSERPMVRREKSCEVTHKTPHTVIIVSKPQVKSELSRFHTRTLKKQSVDARTTTSPRRKVSPNRKQSISAWETAEDLDY